MTQDSRVLSHSTASVALVLPHSAGSTPTELVLAAGEPAAVDSAPPAALSSHDRIDRYYTRSALPTFPSALAVRTRDRTSRSHRPTVSLLSALLEKKDPQHEAAAVQREPGREE